MALTEEFEVSGTTSHKFKVDRNVNQVLIKRTSNVSLLGGLLAGVPERISGTIRNHNNSIESLFREEPRLAHVLQYSQFTAGPLLELAFLEGQVPSGRSLEADAVNASRPYVAYMLVDLTKADRTLEGVKLGLEITSDNDASIKLDNMVVGAHYAFYCQETPVTGTNKLEFTSINLLSGQKRNVINVDHLTAIVLPASENITNIKVQYGIPGSAPLEYSVEDIKYMNAQHNLTDVQQMVFDAEANARPGGQITPLTSDLLVLLLDNATSVEINTNGTQMEFLQVIETPRGVTSIG